MNGIAIVVPNADFSGSPLGRVTPKPSAEEIVNAYLTRVGGSFSDKDRLILLYNSLDAIGALATLDIFPMLGSNLTNRLVGLKPSGSEYLFNSILVGDNASINNNGGISFADVNPNFTGEEQGYVNKEVGSPGGFFFFVNAALKRTGIGVMTKGIVNTSSFYCRHESYNNSKSIFTGYRDIALTISSGNIPEITSVFNSYSVYNTPSMDSPVLKTFYNDVYASSRGFANHPNYILQINNLFGGMVSDPNTHYFNADVRMYAVGKVEQDKLDYVNQAFREYFG